MVPRCNILFIIQNWGNFLVGTSSISSSGSQRERSFGFFTVPIFHIDCCSQYASLCCDAQSLLICNFWISPTLWDLLISMPISQDKPKVTLMSHQTLIVRPILLLLLKTLISFESFLSAFLHSLYWACEVSLFPACFPLKTCCGSWKAIVQSTRLVSVWSFASVLLVVSFF